MHFTYFCKKRGGGGGELRFSVLLRPEFFCVFRPEWSIQMTSLSSVETPVDRRRFVFSSVFVAY